jgi:hypothetical protein
MHRMSMPDESLIIDCPVLSDAAPIVVGGIGGSGTRVVAQLLQSLGFDMGLDLNESLDDLGFTALFKRPSLWPLQDHLPYLKEALDVYLASRGLNSISTSSNRLEHRVAQLLESTRREDEWIEPGNLSHREECLSTPSEPAPLWGWKEPNTHMILPFLLAAMPNMKYIHVTRHGLDMAHSRNQTQMKIWGPHLLGRAVDCDSAEDSLEFWCHSHERVLDLRERSANKVLLLSFETLFTEADLAITSLCNFLKIPESSHIAKLVISDLRRPQTFGRYRNHSPLSLSFANRNVLHQLNYKIEGDNCEEH